MTEREIIERVKTLDGIKELNPMQLKVLGSSARQLILISPTGSGKTIAFGMRILRSLRESGNGLQALILAPSRELVIQIVSVMRQLCRGYKTVAFYGGHSVADEKASLSPVPDIIVATPGRFLDHLQRGNLVVERALRSVVLDEYDKSLQLGFEGEMKRIMRRIGAPSNLTMTSATMLSSFPDYINAANAEIIESLPQDNSGKLEVVSVESFSRDKLDSLVGLLSSMSPGEKAIVFVNHRESADRIRGRLRKEHIMAGLYHGALDQQQRQTAVDLFANGTTPVLVATDLAARGLDITGLDAVVHYHLPVDEATWTHRNGRTARQDASGRVYVITSEADNLAPYIRFDRSYQPPMDGSRPPVSGVATLHISAGRKEKISRGDVLGYVMKNSELTSGEVGKINIYDHYSLVAVPRESVGGLLGTLNSNKLKGKRVRVTEVKF